MQTLHTFDMKNYTADMPRDVRDAVRAIIIRNGKIALVKSETKGHYEFPGGGIESGETQIDTLIRETFEETGLVIIADSISEYGMIKEIRKSTHGNEIFEQNSYYYLAQADDKATDNAHGDYKTEEGYRPEFVDIDIAALTNEKLAGKYDQSDFLKREAYVLRTLLLTRKDMGRTNWPRIVQKEYLYKNFKNSDFTGAAGLLILREIRKPLSVQCNGQPVKIVDTDYQWLQFAFENKYYWLSAMLDENQNIIEYYFDITYGNFITPDGKSWFYDLYLDVVMLPNGDILLLDEDELLEALNQNKINREQYDLANNAAIKLIAEITGKEKELAVFCKKYLKVITG